jgi:RNA polymerase sigma-70 factor, ECF subfamily
VTLSATDHAASLPTDNVNRFEQEAIPYMRQMFPAALRLTHNRSDAEDLIQETFTRAYQKFHLFSPGTNLRAWLHRIMFHVFYSNCRKRRRRPAETLAGDLYDTLDPGAVPASSSAESDALDQLASSPALRALRDLPQCFKAVVYLADIQGYQYAEIADIMGTPIGTVMSRIHRGRRLLRNRLVSGHDAIPAARGSGRRGQPAPARHGVSQPARVRRDLPAPGAVPVAVTPVGVTQGTVTQTTGARTPLAA